MTTVIRHNSLPRMLMAAFLLLAFAQWPAGAADDPDREQASVTPEVLETKIREVAATTNLDEATKGKLTELYRRSLSNLEKARAYRADAESFLQAQKTAPADIAKLRKTLIEKEKVSPVESPRISEKTPLSELEQRLQKEHKHMNYK